jgi:hypothetical protein
MLIPYHGKFTTLEMGEFSVYEDETAMTTNEAKTAFLSMSPNRKMRVLSLLAHNLTICARSAYLPEVNDDLARKKLCGLNELLHVVTSQLMHMVSEDTKRYPDDVFMDILIEKAQMGQCEGDLVRAFEWSSSANLPGPAA